MQLRISCIFIRNFTMKNFGMMMKVMSLVRWWSRYGTMINNHTMLNFIQPYLLQSLHCGHPVKIHHWFKVAYLTFSNYSSIDNAVIKHPQYWTPLRYTITDDMLVYLTRNVIKCYPYKNTGWPCVCVSRHHLTKNKYTSRIQMTSGNAQQFHLLSLSLKLTIGNNIL